VEDKITIIKGEVYKVQEYQPDMKLKHGFAYLKNGLLYPYMGEFIDKFSREPGVYYVGKKKDMIYHFIKPFFIRKGSGYLESSIRSTNTKNILDIIEHEGLIDIDSDVILSEKGKLFVPRISHDDNFLSRIVKTAIVKKKIDLNDYKNRFKSEYELNNYRRALLQNGNMSVDKFLKWCEVLDISFEIRYFDIDSSVQPMNYEGTETE
jgi:hypothetical protein